MQNLTVWKQFVFGFINFRDCWCVRFAMWNCGHEDFWEWLSVGYYDMYIYPFQGYDPWNSDESDPFPDAPWLDTTYDGFKLSIRHSETEN